MLRKITTRSIAAKVLPALASLGAVCFALLPADAQKQPEPKKLRTKIDYNRDIRPILSDKCFTCHGSDPGSLMAGLRLDTRESATALRGNGQHAIVPGKPDKSLILTRINADAPFQMPPPSSKKTLSAEEKALLKQWIAEGAEYKQHWAFVAPVKPPLPTVKDKAWPKKPLDYFILAELERKGLKPSPQTERTTMIRRVTLDLTGLPPTPEEVDAFLADSSPQAYEKVVDRLLASPRYGERMAMDWMDGARYADSNGYQADYERYQYRWRDWVINAFNNNMPYDQFTLEQLAGDMLPNPTEDQVIATGFNRNHRINTEGGVIAEEWRVETVIDRLETTSAVWLALTTGCARCHDHKYDPISQKEFYSMYSYFNNVPESGTGEERAVNHPPFIEAPYPEQLARMRELKQKTETLEKQMEARVTASIEPAQDWTFPGNKPLPSLNDGLVGRYELRPKLQATGSAPQPKASGEVVYEPGRVSGSVTVGDKGYVDLGNAGDFDRTDKFSYGAWVYPIEANGAIVSRMDEGNNYRGWDLFMVDRRPAPHFISSWSEDAVKVISKEQIPLNAWSHVFITYDGTGKKEGIKIYINGKEVGHDAERDSLKGSIRTTVSTKIGRRTPGTFIKTKVDDLAIYSRALTASEVASLASSHPATALLAIPKDQRTADQKRTIARLWLQDKDPEFAALAKSYDDAIAEKVKLQSQIPSVMVMKEMPKPRQAHILIRGQYDKLGEPVSAGIPKVFGSLPAGTPNNRLGLAKWIVSPKNPLTSRVAVNRLWERLFGTGIVETSEDFGTRAEFPSHPELLDYLATDFVAKGWDLKAMIKEIVMSATYRQSSNVTPALLNIDPENRLLARGPRFRLQAEILRDSALAVSGLLKEKIGGKSVYPYQPDGLWNETSAYGNLLNYKHATDGSEYRRSLYTIWKRTAAPPNMTLFDVPTREICRVRRAITNTPLQALALMNEPTYLEAAKMLAQRAIKQGGSTPESRIRFVYKVVLCRAPKPNEMRILMAGLEKRLAKYREDQDAAKKLMMVGESKVDPALDTAELAAYMVLTSTILNLDETLTKE
ncbi:MAG: DUF1553 domain-containing protein [Fimbriimonadaceae bacterium]|nr:DUF1553 domain-containing protein [Fimbriimonadaceae bacterium]